MKDKINVAIDGPAGSGKSTIAKMVAEKSGMTYVDTGAMYRAITWKLLQLNLNPSSITEIDEVIGNIEISFDANNDVCVDGTVLKEEIRTHEIASHASDVAAIKSVRDKLGVVQRGLIKNKNVIMDGRDIGTVIMPDADFKIYLVASPSIRAERRFNQLTDVEKESTSIEEVEKKIILRDEADTTREHSPLKKAEDAVELDTSTMKLDEVVTKVLEIIKK